MIIKYQTVCNWKSANKYILEIQDKILMGHILAQRYLHPKCYRSQFLELSNWLKMYNDHPQAKRIYRLAIRRMPTGYKRPPTPSKALGIAKSNLDNCSGFRERYIHWGKTTGTYVKDNSCRG